MKPLKLLFVGIIAVMCFSCELQDYPIHHTCRLTLSFLDADGNDLVKGIETKDTTDLVAPSQYTLISSPDRYELGYGPRPGVTLDDPHQYPRLRFVYPEEMKFVSPTETREQDNYGLGLFMYVPIKSDLEVITYTLTCPYVFGDEEAREIVTYWRKPANRTQKYHGIRTCHRVVVDGREFTNISCYYLGGYEQVSHLTVTLDR